MMLRHLIFCIKVKRVFNNNCRRNQQRHWFKMLQEPGAREIVIF